MRLLLLLLFVLGVPAHAESPLTDVRFDQRLGAQVPRDLEFRDETGRYLLLGDLLDGRPLVLVPGYYRCPMLCGQVRDGLLDALKGAAPTAGVDFRLVSYSIAPTEGPASATLLRHAALQRYDRRRADWTWLTGSAASIRALSDALGFHAVLDPEKREYAHGSGVVVLTPDGRVARVLYGISFRSRDLELALAEASGGQVGRPLDALLLLCYRYDPREGRYGFAIMTALRLAGVATVLLMGLAILRMRRPA